MTLLLLIGGARSGKSALALRLASEQSAPVTTIATGEPGDAEMAARIDRHRAERPPSWMTIEEPLRLADAIARTPDDDCLVIDCLTVWTANMQAYAGSDATENDAAIAAAHAVRRRGATIAVSNEVGLGLVPDNALGREYRDLLGRVNAIWADAADRAYLLVAGRVLQLERGGAHIEGLR